MTSRARRYNRVVSEPRVDGLRPGGRVTGEVRLPGSKSVAQRVLVAAALAGGRTRIAALPDGDDVRGVLAALEAGGVGVRRPGPAAVTLQGRPPGSSRGLGLGAPARPVVLHVGESGTGARFLTAAAALCGLAGEPLEVRVSGSLARRTSAPLFAALRAAGVTLRHHGAADGWPVTLAPLGPPSFVHIDEPCSSQEVSALLLALAAWPGEAWLEVRGVIPSRPYVELTRGVLARFGVVCTLEDAPGGVRCAVRGPLAAPPEPYVIEPDASAAAVALAAGCLSGGDVRAGGFAGSRQGDVRVTEHLAAFGCDARNVGGELRATGAPTRGARLDLSGEPDLAPVLAAVAGAAALAGRGASRLEGLGTLPGKESSRIAVLARALAALGLEVQAGPAHLAVARGDARPGAVTLDAAGDHRMAFACALLGLVRDGVDVAGAGCVAKSWPTFWTDLERAGARRRTSG
jgi:3-phosphoshikimate 1-carboxyvinyltransferase